MNLARGALVPDVFWSQHDNHPERPAVSDNLIAPVDWDESLIRQGVILPPPPSQPQIRPDPEPGQSTNLGTNLPSEPSTQSNAAS